MKNMTQMDLWYLQLPPADQIPALQKTMRAVFSTPDGAITLAAILEDMHYFHAPRSEAEEALRDYATVLLKDRLGVTTDSLAVTTALLNIGVKEQTDE